MTCRGQCLEGLGGLGAPGLQFEEIRWWCQAACEGPVLLAEELQASAAASSGRDHLGFPKRSPGLEHLLQSLMELLPREPQLDLLEKAMAK